MTAARIVKPVPVSLDPGLAWARAELVGGVAWFEVEGPE
jgi:hypothetical protein